MYQLLKPQGIVALEEGVVNHAFTYPYNIAFGNERFEILNHHENVEGKDRDGNFGIKLWHTLHHAGFQELALNMVAPTLTSKEEKAMLLPGFIDSKDSVLSSGVSEAQWQQRLNALQQLIEDEASVVGFYQSVQACGRKNCNTMPK